MAAAAGEYAVRVFLQRDLGPTPGSTYSINIGVMVAPCPDDSFEDNDEPFLAPFVSPGTTAGVNVCTGDDDYFNIFVDAGETITVNVRFTNAEGDIDLALLGFLNIPVATSVSVDDDESVTYTEPDGRTVHGRDAVEKLLAIEHGSVFKQSKLNLVVERVMFVTPDVAVADGSYELFDAKDPRGRAIGVRRGHAGHNREGEQKERKQRQQGVVRDGRREGEVVALVDTSHAAPDRQAGEADLGACARQRAAPAAGATRGLRRHGVIISRGARSRPTPAAPRARATPGACS